MKFKWEAWDLDGPGDAYVIAKRWGGPRKEDVPGFIIREDNLHPHRKDGMVVSEVFFKYQVRTDWAGYEGEPKGGWFPVWIVRRGTVEF